MTRCWRCDNSMSIPPLSCSTKDPSSSTKEKCSTFTTTPADDTSTYSQEFPLVVWAIAIQGSPPRFRSKSTNYNMRPQFTSARNILYTPKSSQPSYQRALMSSTSYRAGLRPMLSPPKWRDLTPATTPSSLWGMATTVCTVHNICPACRAGTIISQRPKVSNTARSQTFIEAHSQQMPVMHAQNRQPHNGMQMT